MMPDFYSSNEGKKGHYSIHASESGYQKAKARLAEDIKGMNLPRYIVEKPRNADTGFWSEEQEEYEK